MLRVCPSIVCELDIKENGTEMSEIVETGISDVSNTQSIRKFRLKILKFIDEKCPIETRVTFGDGDESAITITFLEREHEHVRKPTRGGRGSRERRRNGDNCSKCNNNNRNNNS